MKISFKLLHKNTSESNYLIFIAMLYMTLMILCSIIGFKLINTSIGIISGASLICPFLFLMGDVVAEVYGYKVAINLFFLGLACKVILVLVGCAIIYLPSPPEWNHQNSFNLIIGSLPKIYGYSILGMTLSWVLNAFILTRWKYIVSGKYFWFRSISTSGFGETVFSLVSVTLTLFGTVKSVDIPSIVIWSLSLKIIFTILFSYPITIIVNWLKEVEGMDIYDNISGLNPFREATNENKDSGTPRYTRV